MAPLAFVCCVVCPHLVDHFYLHADLFAFAYFGVLRHHFCDLGHLVHCVDPDVSFPKISLHQLDPCKKTTSNLRCFHGRTTLQSDPLGISALHHFLVPSIYLWCIVYFIYPLFGWVRDRFLSCIESSINLHLESKFWWSLTDLSSRFPLQDLFFPIGRQSPTPSFPSLLLPNDSQSSILLKWLVAPTKVKGSTFLVAIF